MYWQALFSTCDCPCYRILCQSWREGCGGVIWRWHGHPGHDGTRARCPCHSKWMWHGHPGHDRTRARCPCHSKWMWHGHPGHDGTRARCPCHSKWRWHGHPGHDRTRARCPCLEFLHFRSKGTKAASRPAVVPVVMAGSRDFPSLAPLGERVASSRRCHQPGRDG